jgi:hypothetical protein
MVLLINILQVDESWFNRSSKVLHQRHIALGHPPCGFLLGKTVTDVIGYEIHDLLQGLDVTGMFWANGDSSCMSSVLATDFLYFDGKNYMAQGLRCTTQNNNEIREIVTSVNVHCTVPDKKKKAQ